MGQGRRPFGRISVVFAKKPAPEKGGDQQPLIGVVSINMDPNVDHLYTLTYQNPHYGDP